MLMITLSEKHHVSEMWAELDMLVVIGAEVCRVTIVELSLTDILMI